MTERRLDSCRDPNSDDLPEDPSEPKAPRRTPPRRPFPSDLDPDAFRPPRFEPGGVSRFVGAAPTPSSSPLSSDPLNPTPSRPRSSGSQSLRSDPILTEHGYREFFRVSPVGMVVLDAEGTICAQNDAAARILDMNPRAPARESLVSFVVPEHHSRFAHHFQSARGADGHDSTEIELRSLDGQAIPVWMTSQVLPDRLDRVFTTIIDLRERKEAEKAQRLRDRCIEATNNGIVILNAAEEKLPVFSCNAAFEHMTGFRSYEVVDQGLELLRGEDTDLESWARLQLALSRGLSSRETLECYRKNGIKFWAELAISPVTDANRTLTHFVCVMSDISERVRSEQALKISEERYRLISELTAHVAYSCRRSASGAMNFEWLRGEYPEMTGYSLSDLKGFDYWLPIVHEDDQQLALDRLDKLRAGQADVAEFRIVKSDGKVAWIRDYARPIRDGNSGAIDRIYGAARDITEERRAEVETIELEEKLRQSTKMEAIGRLAGGVAHDFNNLLTTLMGNASVLRSLPLDQRFAVTPGEESPSRLAKEVYDAAARASQLTRQLLAFSRKQILEPEVFDLNPFLHGAIPMLRRLIREDVSVQLDLEELPCWIRVDRGQVHQIVVNLCVNAQDAMPMGGEIDIRTRVTELVEETLCQPSMIPPGRYVTLSVCDSGDGISKEDQEHIFEPFFTTKEVGEGTGLGLATVYGITRQSGGYVGLESQLREGTRFDVYLPRVEEPNPSSEAPRFHERASGGQERVLVVEDEPEVRGLLCRVLQSAGYSVESATNGKEALPYLEDSRERFDLLVTDVIMPLMGGKQLAEQFAVRSPSTRVLFISGYTNDAIARHGVINQEVNFLQKPFLPSEFTAKVRQVLDQGKNASIS